MSPNASIHLFFALDRNRPRYCIFLYALFLSTASLSCKKEISPLPVNPPVSPDTIYVPIHYACDTTMGVATAKKLTANWRAGVSARKVVITGATYWVIELKTCTKNGSDRERLTFGAIPESNPVQHYTFQYWHTGVISGTVDPRYYTLAADGDVLEDVYSIDTTVTVENFFEIDLCDTVNRRVEGHFSFAGDIRQPRTNAQNPKKVTFTSGKFWVRLPE